MPFMCAYKGCFLKKGERASLFSFPDENSICKAWLQAAGREDLLQRSYKDIRKNYKICEKHFGEGFVAKSSNCLFNNDVPSQYTAEDTPEEIIILSDEEQESIQSNQNMSSSNKGVDEPLDEQEIIIKTLEADDLASDPLQCSETLPSSTKPDTNISETVTPLAIPIIIRTIANPSEELLRQIKQQNLKKLSSSDIAKLAAGQQGMVKNKRKFDEMEISNQPSTSRFTAKKDKEDIVKNIPSGSESVEAQKTGTVQDEKTNNVVIEKDNLCALPQCTEHCTHYFKVPEDSRKSRIWSFCLNLPELESGDLICDKHFIPEDILIKSENSNIGVVKGFAVPSLRKVLVGCCISQCINQHRNTANMFPIPIWGNYSAWLNYTIDAKLNITKMHDLQQYRVCEIHFAPHYLSRLHRGFDMMPTVNLPTKQYYEEKLQTYLEHRGSRIQQVTGNLRVTVEPRPTPPKNPNLVQSDTYEYCTFAGCKLNKEDTYIRFYKFPVEYDRAIKWLEGCSRYDILHKSRIDIEKFFAMSIGVCFKHKNAVEMRIGKKEVSANADKNTGTTGQENVNTIEESVISNEKEEPPSLHDPKQSTEENPIVPVRKVCAFVNCSTHIKDAIKKYRFPADNELLAKWIEATGVPRTLSEDTLRTLFVCGKHFKIDQYTEMGTLIFSSIPTPHTEYVDNISHEGNEHWIMKKIKKKSQPIETCSGGTLVSGSASQIQPSTADTDSISFLQEDVCIVKHCNSNRRTNVLYPFPQRDPNIMIRWVIAVKNKEDKERITLNQLTAYYNKHICNKHFETRFQIGRNLLRQDAVPTLDLVEVEVMIDQKIDTSITWKECSDILPTDIPAPNTLAVKGHAILRTNSIQFPNIRRELRFGKDCQKVGYFRKFPYKVARMVKGTLSREVDSINGQRLQIHTAVIVDDDDEAEKEALKVISRIIRENANLVRSRAPKKIPAINMENT